MKKNIISLLVIFSMFVTLPVFAAQTIQVQALSEYDSNSPVEKMTIMATEKVQFENGIIWENGTVVEGKVFDSKEAKRGKRNATFKFQPVSYTYNGRVKEVSDPVFVAKFKHGAAKTKGEAALDGAASVGGILLNVPGLSQGVSMIKGVVKNKEDNRLKSGVAQVYKDSPLSYIEEGKDIILKKDDKFLLKFKCSDAEDLDAYTEEFTQKTEQETIMNEKIHNSVDKVTTEVHAVKDTITSVPAKVHNLTTPHPDEVLKEVELNTK